jgi:hypothetical protein
MRRAGREGKRGQLKERIAQLRDEIRGSETIENFPSHKKIPKDMMSRKHRAPVKDFCFIICLVRPNHAVFPPRYLASSLQVTGCLGNRRPQGCSRLLVAAI